MTSFYSTPGPAATIEIGEVTRLEPGTTPAVTNTGTPTAAVLNFAIPQGDSGTVSTLDQGSAASPSIFFTGDPNTGIYSPGADQLALSTNGTGRLFVDANGNVGVGSSNTTSTRLEISRLGGSWTGSAPVTGTALIAHSGGGAASSPANMSLLGGNASAGGIYFGDTDASSRGAVIYDHSSDTLWFGTNGANERLRITSAGLVGIGTSTPAAEVHLAKIAAPTGETRNALRITAGNTFGGEIVGYLNQGVNAGIAFSTVDTGVATERMRITPTGVGIGTTSPGTKLDVAEASATNVFARVGNSNGFADFGAAAGGTIYGPYAAANTAQSLLVGTSTNAPLTFWTNASEKARIDTSGRLLVGTSSAYGQNYLQIQGDQVNGATGFGGISLRRGIAPSGIGNGSQLGFIDFGPNDGGVGARISAWGDAQNGTNDYPSRLVFSTTPDGSASPVERMRIKSSGIINFSNAPVYADNTAALAGGLVAGDVYRKSDGTLMITY